MPCFPSTEQTRYALHGMRAKGLHKVVEPEHTGNHRPGQDFRLRINKRRSALLTSKPRRYRFASTASQNSAAMSVPPNRFTSRTPVGEVTLISVM
jgi:hypothetical protein